MPTSIAELRIGAMIPQRIDTVDGHGIDPAGIIWLTSFLLALDEINNSSNILPSTRLSFAWRDTQREQVASMRAAFELEGICHSTAHDVATQPVVAVVGPSSSDETSAVANVLGSKPIPLISFFATSPTLSDGETYPYVFRTSFSDKIQAEALVDILIDRWQFTRVALVSSSDLYGAQGAIALTAAAMRRNLTISASLTFPEGTQDFRLIYQDLEAREARVIILFMHAVDAGPLLRGAFEHGLGGPGFLFIGSDATASSSLWELDNTLDGDQTLRERVLQGFFALAPTSGTPERLAAFYERLQARPSTLQNPSTGECSTEADDDGRKLWAHYQPGTAILNCTGSDNQDDDKVAPFAYDATYALAQGLHHLVEIEGVASVDGERLADALLRNVSFEGVTGPVRFYEPPPGAPSWLYRGDRRVGVNFTLLNFQDAAAELVDVGTWTPCPGQVRRSSSIPPPLAAARLFIRFTSHRAAISACLSACVSRDPARGHGGLMQLRHPIRRGGRPDVSVLDCRQQPTARPHRVPARSVPCYNVHDLPRGRAHSHLRLRAWLHLSARRDDPLRLHRRGFACRNQRLLPSRHRCPPQALPPRPAVETSRRDCNRAPAARPLCHCARRRHRARPHAPLAAGLAPPSSLHAATSVGQVSRVSTPSASDSPLSSPPLCHS